MQNIGQIKMPLREIFRAVTVDALTKALMC